MVEALFEVDISSVFEATEDIYANGNCETVDIQLIKERFKANSPATLTLEEQWEILSSTLHTGTSATGPSEPAPELQPPGHLPATLADFNAMTVHEIQQYRYDIPDGVDYARDIAPLARRLHEHTEFFRFGHASIFGIRAYREGPKSGLEFASMALDADMRVQTTHSVILEWLADIIRMEGDQRIPTLTSFWDLHLVYKRDLMIIEEKEAMDKLGDMSWLSAMELQGPPKVLPEHIYYSGDMKPESLEATYAANWRDPSWIRPKPAPRQPTGHSNASP